MVHILIIDDDRAIRDFLRSALESRGHRVSTAENGYDALSVFDHTVDLVITDMIMPHMNGAETIHCLKAKSPGLPIIGISGGGSTPARTFLGVAITVGADRTLEKPFNVLALYQAVAAVLKKSERRDATRPAECVATSIGSDWHLAAVER